MYNPDRFEMLPGQEPVRAQSNKTKPEEILDEFFVVEGLPISQTNRLSWKRLILDTAKSLDKHPQDILDSIKSAPEIQQDLREKTLTWAESLGEVPDANYDRAFTDKVRQLQKYFQERLYRRPFQNRD
jgi:hypothetical protein